MADSNTYISDSTTNKITLILTILSVLIVFSGMFTYIITGVWPPFMITHGDSMNPTLSKNDLIIGMDIDKSNYKSSIKTVNEVGFNNSTIIVYNPTGGSFNENTNIIHRAWKYTEKNENWVKDINKTSLPFYADTCLENKYCPAPNSGYITKGDNNNQYDQVEYSSPAKPKNVIAKVILVIPNGMYLTYIGTTIVSFTIVLLLWNDKLTSEEEND